LPLNLNSTIMKQVVDVLEKAITRTRKSPHEIINTLSNLHPELLFTPEDWEQLSQETKDGIINRVRKTLESLT